MHRPTPLHRTILRAVLLCMLSMARLLAASLVDHVDPRMGTFGNGEGNVVIGPQLPWGSINPSPDTPKGYTSGYHHSQKIRGFSQLHATGTGGPGKYGQFLLSPQIGLNVAEDGHDSAKEDEQARLGHYAVTLKDYAIHCAVTPTHHAASYRFTYPASDRAHVLLDLGHTINRDSNFFKGGYAEDGAVEIDAATRTVRGWGHYWGGWSSEPFRVFFAARYDREADAIGTWKDGVTTAGKATEQVTAARQRIGAFLRFRTEAMTTVQVKIAVSFTSMYQALRHLDAEIPAWDFDAVRSAAEAAWEGRLGRIRVDGGTSEQRTIFYSSLYNAMRMPRDRSGDNPKWASTVPYWDDHYCVWDTWRTVFPLHVLINESMVRDNLKAFCDRFRMNGQVADAFIAGNDRFYEWHGDGNADWLGNQGGDNVTNVIVDAYVKGVRGVDWEDCWRIVRYSADAERAPSYRSQDRGWIPYRTYHFGQYCSRSLEFAYNDFCAATMAGGLGKAEHRNRLLARSRRWTGLWNGALASDGFTGFIAPRTMDGTFVAYDPKRDVANASPGGIDRSFYEGSSWVYSYGVPHDLRRLIAMMGGPAAYCTRLEHALTTGEHDAYLFGKEDQIRLGRLPGLIDFTNEPSFLTLFSFIHAGRPDLAARWVRTNIANYSVKGFPGDEDSGAMGSWLVFAALGLFPNAGQDTYLLNGPLFPRTAITREDGSVITIEGIGAAPDAPYVQSATIDGRPLDRAWIRHSEIARGATLRFVMGPRPSAWGSTELPPSLPDLPTSP